MIQVTKNQFESLKENNLIKFDVNNKNFRITSKSKGSGAKKYYVEESYKIINFLRKTS